MSLPLKNFDTLVSDQVAAIQAKSDKLMNFDVGSVVRAEVESNAGVSLWMQAQAQIVLAVTRLVTSTGPTPTDPTDNIATFLEDFGTTGRLPAVAATGNVAFSRLNSSTQTLIQVGASVETVSGTVRFVVVADTSNPNYSADLGGYIVQVGISSISIPVRCLSPGIAGNVAPNVITVISSPILGVTSVTNPSAFVNGQAEESDEAARNRFINYLAGLAKANPPAIRAAIELIQNGIKYNLVEMLDYTTGLDRRGYFYVVVDDGSGAPPNSLVQSVSNAMEITRACGIRQETHGATPLTVNVTVNVTKVSGSDTATVKANVEAAIRAGLTALQVGEALSYTRIYDFIYEASSNVKNASGALVNSGTSDISVTGKQKIIAGTVTATVT